MTVGDRIKQRRKQLGMSAETLAECIGKSAATVYRYEKGDISKIDSDALLPIAQALITTPAYLMGWDDVSNQPEQSSRPLPSNLRPLGDLHRQRVPLIGSVAAGQPIMAEQDYETFVDAPVDCDAALEVKGDSMKPTYLTGDILYIKCMSDVPDGQVAVVLLDDEATLKHVYHDPNGLTLISDNPDYPPIRAHSGEYDYIAIYGVPVGYTRIYRSDPKKKIKKGMTPRRAQS